MSEHFSKNVKRLEFDGLKAKVDDMSRHIDYVDTKLRSKLDYLLKEIHKLRGLDDLEKQDSGSCCNSKKKCK